MFVHLGADISVSSKDIIGIFDISSTTTSNSTKEFLEIAKDEGLVVNVVNEDKVKSFIITKEKVYLSPISSLTLQKRSISMRVFEEYD